MKAVKQLNIIYLLPCILVSKLTEDCIFVLMRWYKEGSFKIEQHTCLPHLCPFPQPSSSEPLLPPTVAASGCCCLWGGGSLDTAAHLHQENTSIQFQVAEAVYPRYLYLSCTSDAVVFFSCVVKCHAIMNTWRILPICTNFSFVGFPGH